MTHWENPWKEAVPVPIEELAECHGGIGKLWATLAGENEILTKEQVLEHWKLAGDKLDAYILPQSSGDHCIGIRYGKRGHEYLSPMGDPEKVARLLDKYHKKAAEEVLKLQGKIGELNGDDYWKALFRIKELAGILARLALQHKE